MLKQCFQLSSDDIAFVKNLNERFPHLLPAFEALQAIAPEDRPGYAREKLKTVLRKGYVIRGVPDGHIETVHDHIEAAKELAVSWTPDGYDKDLIIRMLDIHDIAEAITGDFTIHDDISKAEKMRLEDITARLIFAAAPDLYALWQSFENKQCPEACIGHDIEKAQIFFRCLQYEAAFPYLSYKFDDFWNNRAEKWSSETGPQMYEHTIKQRNRLHGPVAPLPVHPKNL